MFLKKKIESWVAISIIIVVSIVTAAVVLNEGKRQADFYDNYYGDMHLK